MGQRNRQYDRGEDERRDRYGSRSPYRSSEQGSGGREQEGSRGSWSNQGYSEGDRGRSADRQGFGSQYRGGESIRRDIEDNWSGREGRSSARDYDYGYGRSGVSERDYDREYGYGGRESHGGGGLYGGGMGGYTGGSYRGGGLGSNYDTSSSSTDYSDYPRSEGGYSDRGRGRQGEGWWDRMTNEVSSWFGGEDDRESGRGSHRGRGPRGYTRSDDRIKEDINDRLTDHYAIDASEIDIEVTGAEVVLSGTVNSRYEKRLAEDVAEAVSGVSNVENRLRVSRAGSSSMYGDTSSTSYGDSGSTSGTSSMTDSATTTDRGRSATSG